MRYFLIVPIAILMSAASAPGVQLTVVDVEPTPNVLGPRNAPIVVHFDRAVDRASVTDRSFWAFAHWSGAVSGTFSFSNGDRTVTLTPDRDFFAAEQVMVILSHDLVGADTSPMREAGYSYRFMTRSKSARMEFRQIDSLSTRTTPNQGSRAYGGVAADVNHDGWADLTIVNEDTADLRVFLNKADGTGLFHDFLRPPSPVQNRASPSEPADFDRDGITDICIANLNTNTVSVLRGRGDGTFDPQQVIPVGLLPRGIVVLDADGDGDLDIANTNANSSNMSLLINDGAGVFSPAVFFEGGGSGEWGLSTADMNSDGILDLVVGARSSRDIHILTGNGDGTFTHASRFNAGGSIWVLNACGDLNGDGTVDVATANSTSNTGTIVFGDGAGNLTSATTYPGMSFAISTDVGDLDGDGDLDWIVSSFSGDWRIFTNDGSGLFTFDQTITAPSSASCAIVVDLDNDDRADLALVDEIRDVVLLELNWCYADCDQSTGMGELDLFDFLCFQNSFVSSESYACDCDTSTGLLVCDLFDFLCFQDAFVGGCP